MPDRWVVRESVQGRWSLQLRSHGTNRVLVDSASFAHREEAVRYWKAVRWAAFFAFFNRLVEEPRNVLP